MRCLLLIFVLAATSLGQSPKCLDCGPGTQRARAVAYKRLIEPLLRVPDFRMHYVEDGAADDTVTCPERCEGYPSPKPVPEVAALMKNPAITVPLLIDCLDDARQTSIQFDGNVMTNPMKVPMGYVCLDILIWRFDHEPIAEYGCGSDGLLACVNTPYSFRPDDYTRYWGKGNCDARPWVLVVQRNWKRALKTGSLWKAMNGRALNLLIR